MRKVRVYFQFFLAPVLLFILSVIAWFYVPNSVNATQGGILGAVLGVGLSISVAESFKKIVEHQRRKKTFGLLKLVTVPYLKGRAKSLVETMRSYNDIDSFGKAIEFLAMSSHFDIVAQSFDKEWFQLVYSQDFLDAINSDAHFSALTTPIKEVLLMTDQLTSQSINAKLNLSNDFSKLTDKDKEEFIGRARQIRDDIMDNALKLQKYTTELDKELTVFLQQNGVIYTEVDR